MKYAITVEATIRKTLVVEADSEQAAIEQAHAEFDIMGDGNGDEHYDEQTIAVREI